MFKIKRAVEIKVPFHCQRCGVELVDPVEETSLYVWNGKDPELICTKCVRKTDTYIWGQVEYLDDSDGGNAH